MFRHVGLDHHISRVRPPPGPPGGLGEQLKGSLPAGVIRGVEREVRCQHPHQGHLGKVMSLYDHLGPDEDVRLPRREGGEDLLVSPLARGGVHVHPQDSRPGKHGLCHLLRLLGPHPESGDVGGAAGRTPVRHGDLIPAVVAFQPPIPVQGQAHVAVGTFHRLSAGAAGHEIGVAPPVDEQHGLLPLLQSPLHQLPQPAAENGFVSLPQLLPQVHHLHLGQAAVLLRPLRQGQQAVSAALRTAERLQGRGGRPEHQPGSGHGGPFFRHIPGVVAGSQLALVGALLLLIHDDQPQALKGGEKGGPGADHHLDLPLPRPLKLIVALPLGEPGIDDGHPVPEPPVKAHHRLVGEGDLRDQHDHLSPIPEHLVHHLHIHFRFSAAGDAVEQIEPRSLRPPIPDKGIRSRPLLPVQLHSRPPALQPRDWIAVDVLLLQPDPPFLLHGPYGRRREPQLGQGKPIGDLPHIKERAKQPLPGPVMLSPRLRPQPLQLLRREVRAESPLLHRADLLLHRQNRLQRLVHGGAVPLLHPPGQLDEL